MSPYLILASNGRGMISRSHILISRLVYDIDLLTQKVLSCATVCSYLRKKYDLLLLYIVLPQVYRNSTEYRPQQERESPNQYNSKPKTVGAPPRPQVKASPNPKGSITLGTPVETRFEPHRNPPEPKTGSITAGTPVHPHHLPDKRTLEFYKRRSPGGPAAYYAAASSQPRPQSPSFSPVSIFVESC